MDFSSTIHGMLVKDFKSCTSLHFGRTVHARAMDSQNDSDIYIVTALIRMYGKCGNMVDAQQVFENLSKPNVVSWTCLILGYAENGEEVTALRLFSKMKEIPGCLPNSVTYLAVIKACTSLAVNKDGFNYIELSRQVHSEIGCHINHQVQTALVEMYAKFGSMFEAHEVFDNIQTPNVVSWTSLILGYAENGECLEALKLFDQMKAEECTPNSLTYVAVLKACTSLALKGDPESCLKWGKKIRLEVGCHLNQYVRNTLIDMYSKCGKITEAHQIFNSIHETDVVSWNSLILGYVENGEELIALDLFNKMKTSNNILPNSVTYMAVVKACTSLAFNGDQNESLQQGRKIHSEIGCHLNSLVESTLIEMYAKCGSLVEARQVFDNIQIPNVVSWSSMILGYAEKGEGQTALDLFNSMKTTSKNVPNAVTYSAALKACTALAMNGNAGVKAACLEQGRKIHSEIGCHFTQCVQNSLIDMYAKCGSMVEARFVFDSMLKPDVVSWSALLLGYAVNGQGLVSLYLFREMKVRGCVPNSLTYVAVLKGCISLASEGDGSGKEKCLAYGRVVHSEIGSHMNHHVQSVLLSMYAKCGKMVEARDVFNKMNRPNVASWIALILGYADDGDGLAALDLYYKMKKNGYPLDAIVYTAALKACTTLAVNGDKELCLKRSREIHLEIGHQIDDYVKASLIKLYSKCGCMVEAHRMFESIQVPDSVSWTALLSGYAENGEGHVVLELFSRMKELGCHPDPLAYVAAIGACSNIGSLELGQKVHSEITEFTPYLLSCLVDFYVKCGSMFEARRAFDLHPGARDIATCNALLAGYGRFGNSNLVFGLFQTLQYEGFRPDAITFVIVLLCCSHAGLVEKSKEYFEMMHANYGIKPSIMHYTCLVDGLARANHMSNAIAVIQSMPCKPDATTWRSLLSACCKWENLKIGKLAFHSLQTLDQMDASAHIFMSRIYGMQKITKNDANIIRNEVS